MGDYKIRLMVDIEDMKAGIANTEVRKEIEITDKEACSIDFMDKLLLSKMRETLKETVKEHFEEVSKKNSNTAINNRGNGDRE